MLNQLKPLLAHFTRLAVIYFLIVEVDVVSGFGTPWKAIADDINKDWLEIDSTNNRLEFDKLASAGPLHRFNKIEH